MKWSFLKAKLSLSLCNTATFLNLDFDLLRNPLKLEGDAQIEFMHERWKD